MAAIQFGDHVESDLNGAALIEPSHTTSQSIKAAVVNLWYRAKKHRTGIGSDLAAAPYSTKGLLA